LLIIVKLPIIESVGIGPATQFFSTPIHHQPIPAH